MAEQMLIKEKINVKGLRSGIKKKIALVLLCIFILLVLICFISIYLSNFAFEVENYTVECEGISGTVRFLHLSDLHNSSFGADNARLIKAAEKESPDIIFLTGDMVSMEEEDSDTACSLIRELTKIAPVYASLGNHEIGYDKSFGTDITVMYREAGAVVLDGEYIDIEIGGNALRIAGIYGYCVPEYLEENPARMWETEFMKTVQDTDRTIILLCHMPVSWLEYGSLEAWDVDLVLAGHAHGGQIRFPFAGGLYAPDQGWFPGRVAGMYASEDGGSTLILSRGLGGKRPVLRFNNIPELISAVLTGGE